MDKTLRKITDLEEHRPRLIGTGRAGLLESASALSAMRAWKDMHSKEYGSMWGKDLKDFLHAFNAHKVDYLVVGAYALGVYAEPRATKDLDVWIRNSESNRSRSNKESGPKSALFCFVAESS